MPDGKTKFIKIENLTLNITQIAKQNVDKQINASGIGAVELAKMQALLEKKGS